MIRDTRSAGTGFALTLLATWAVCGCTTTTTVTTAGNRSQTISSSKPKAAPTPAPPVASDANNAAVATATRQVIAAEQGFAKTMADRNFKAFVTFLSQDAVFFGGSEVARGPAAVASRWENYFVGRQAPFSWTPDHVEVIASGDLALSTGPVFQDHKIVGRFNSIWRLEAPNTWRIVFDKGEAVCGP
jgi:ketosteroid isomerase-like protein